MEIFISLTCIHSNCISHWKSDVSEKQNKTKQNKNELMKVKKLLYASQDTLNCLFEFSL